VSWRQEHALRVGADTVANLQPGAGKALHRGLCALGVLGLEQCADLREGGLVLVGSGEPALAAMLLRLGIDPRPRVGVGGEHGGGLRGGVLDIRLPCRLGIGAREQRAAALVALIRTCSGLTVAPAPLLLDEVALNPGLGRVGGA
jgi:hypothetical protein